MRIDVLCYVLALSYHVEGATTGSTCTNSFACGTGNCCRDSNKRTLTTQEGGGGIFGGPSLGHQSGTCSTLKAQKGEMCDGSCQCDTGLSCYRPMSGVCCPPRTCMDADYVTKQQAYWSNCFSDPNCAIPP